MRGRLITLEGGEGAGKSTQVRFVCEWLEQRGRNVCVTREPGGTPQAEAIRQLVLSDWGEGVTPQTEVLLMYAARSAHLQHKIEPRLAAGDDVVCDRFADSSYAYQGAKGVSDQHLLALESLVLAGRKPDLTLLLDLPPDIGLARAHARGQVNRFEAETLGFMTQVRQRFLQRASDEPGRIAVIDASRSLEQVQAQIAAALEVRL
ncbi:dTMP kinase [Sinimarinibacterium sp. CAU 1509]|uniref:dTMP kinase n=1 Tax=Sinimarinibacterium sp. CAU 1509 TaxID=2562283 RepID=UPI0010AC96DE|nr:dTMP kinase [Sinimarinibacterium sp. CAU 1509]TJY55767.1 dTMP kinase [Sinimarinibacterium sp. CAU 1509]